MWLGLFQFEPTLFVNAPTVQVEYDYGTNQERRTKEVEDTNKARKFIAAKEKAGKTPKVLKENHQRKAKPKFKVTALTKVVLGPTAAFSPKVNGF